MGSYPVVPQTLEIKMTQFHQTEEKVKMGKKLTGGTHKGKQEVESKEGEFWGRLGFGDEVQETNVREERESEEL